VAEKAMTALINGETFNLLQFFNIADLARPPTAGFNWFSGGI